MSIRYATQVLSNTMATVLKQSGTPDFQETAKSCEMFELFDCLNVRSAEESKRKLKPFLKVYSSRDDRRFDWLLDTFLSYLTSWKENINN